MAGIRPLSPADYRIPALGPPGGAPHRPAPWTGRPSDTLDLSAGSKELSRAILLKVALEGKDFQTARREVLAEMEGQPSQEPVPAPPPSDFHAMQVDVQAVRIDFEHLEVDVASGGRSVHVEVTQIHIQAVSLSASRTAASALPKQDPLLLDLDGDGASTTGAEGARPFDLAGDGDPRATSFVTGGDAFLALDRDGDGTISSGLELFGDQHGAMDGYEELRTFDANRDAVINAQDPVFGKLRLLFSDGHLASLQDAGIAALSLDAQESGALTASGDGILRQSTALREDGRMINTYALGLQRFDSVG